MLAVGWLLKGGGLLGGGGAGLAGGPEALAKLMQIFGADCECQVQTITSLHQHCDNLPDGDTSLTP